VPAGSNDPATTTDAVLADTQPAAARQPRASFALPLKDIPPDRISRACM
jgi:hypothetical protein